MSTKIIRILTQILFLVSALGGMALFGSLTWAGLEAWFYFGYGLQGSDNLRLSCPSILTADETGTVTAYVRNYTHRDVEPVVEANISSTLIRLERAQLQTAAGQTVPVEWQVGAADVVFGHLIIVDVFQHKAFILPTADAECGILFLDIHGLTGRQVYFIALGISLAGMLAALALWWSTHRPLDGRPADQMGAMAFATGIVAVGVLFASVGWWAPGVVAFAVAALLITILVTQYMLAPTPA